MTGKKNLPGKCQKKRILLCFHQVGNDIANSKIMYFMLGKILISLNLHYIDFIKAYVYIKNRHKYVLM